MLGVAGGIAAYKAVEVCRRLVDAGAYVGPVLTEDAPRFIGAVTFSALASEPARTSLFDGPDPIPHTRLGQAADLIVVAPPPPSSSASTPRDLRRPARPRRCSPRGRRCLSRPAMHTEMWEHPAVQENLATLRRRGVHVRRARAGRLAGGDVGAGRLADPERIVAAAPTCSSRGRDLAGVPMLVTAGGTREPIDPVRFITNRSSGKMGYAVAGRRRPAGRASPSSRTADRPVPPASVERRAGRVGGGDAPRGRRPFADVDVVVMAAAVADFRPKAMARPRS